MIFVKALGLPLHSFKANQKAFKHVSPIFATSGCDFASLIMAFLKFLAACPLSQISLASL
jgi:hypothetical protein